MSPRAKTLLLASFAAAALSACAGGAVIPANLQTEQIKEAEKTIESVEKMVEGLEVEQQQRINDICSGAAVEGFNC